MKKLLLILFTLFVLNNWHDAAHFALTNNKTLELITVPLFNFLWSGKNWYENHNYFHQELILFYWFFHPSCH